MKIDFKTKFSEIILRKVLVCPCCGNALGFSPDGKSFVCTGARSHCYDISARGYVNLSPHHSGGGDSKEAVASRSAFLDRGRYEPVADKLCKMLSKYLPTRAVIADAGCGEGYYSVKLAESGFDVLGFDLSKFAVDAAAKRATRCGTDKKINAFFGVASVYELPLADKSVDCVVNIFAPCVPSEYARVLKDGGIFAVVGAAPVHLMGLKKLIYENTYENGERSDLPNGWNTVETHRLTYDIILQSREEVCDLFAMTPYYWHTSQCDREKLADIRELKTPVDMMITLYSKPKETI